MFRSTLLIFFFCVVSVKCEVQKTEVLLKTCGCGNPHGSVLVQRVSIPFRRVEGLYWWNKRKDLIFVDKANASIGFYNPEAGYTYIYKIKELEGTPFSAVFPISEETGKLALYARRSLYTIKLTKDYKSIESVHHVTNLTNDEKFCISKGTLDPDGKFIGGLVYINASDYKQGQSKVVRLVTKGKVEVVAKGFNMAEGIAFNRYYDKMYVVDRQRNQICQFDYDSDSGEAKNKKVIFDVESFEELGNTTLNCITMDKEDNLYIGLIGSYQIIAFNVPKRVIIRKIGIPNSVVSSMSFGGKSWSVLYIGTAQIMPNVKYPDLTKEPTAGSIYGIYGLTSAGFPKPDYHISS